MAIEIGRSTSSSSIDISIPKIRLFTRQYISPTIEIKCITLVSSTNIKGVVREYDIDTNLPTGKYFIPRKLVDGQLGWEPAAYTFELILREYENGTDMPTGCVFNLIKYTDDTLAWKDCRGIPTRCNIVELDGTLLATTATYNIVKYVDGEFGWEPL